MDIITSVLNWGPIRAWIKRNQGKPEPDEALDAENAPVTLDEQTIVSGFYEYGNWEEDVPTGHAYYFPDDGIVKIYYRHWPMYSSPVTEKEEKQATDGFNAEAIFEAFMQEKSMAIIDDEFRDPEYMKTFLDGDDDDYESKNFESGDVVGYWIPFPWDWDQGRFYFFRLSDLQRITKEGEELGPGMWTTGVFPSKNTNHDICKIDDAEKFFREHIGVPGKVD